MEPAIRSYLQRLRTLKFEYPYETYFAIHNDMPLKMASGIEVHKVYGGYFMREMTAGKFDGIYPSEDIASVKQIIQLCKDKFPSYFVLVEMDQVIEKVSI